MGYNPSLDIPRVQQKQVGGSAVNKILDKIAPSERVRGVNLKKDYLSDMYNQSINNIGKMFHVDDDGDLSLAMDEKTGEYLTKPFPTLSAAFDDYKMRAENSKVEPNLVEFQQMYETTKKIYNGMLSKKLAGAQARGFDMSDIQDALHNDSNFAMSNYINDNVMDEGLAAYSAAADLQGSGMINTAKGAFGGETYIDEAAAALGVYKTSGIKTGPKGALKYAKKNLKSNPAKVKAIMKGKGAKGRFIKTVMKIAGPKVAKKLAITLASSPIKASVPILGWAWLAYDLVSLGLDKDMRKAIKGAWLGENENYKNTQF